MEPSNARVSFKPVLQLLTANAIPRRAKVKGSGGSSALTAQRHGLQRFTTQLRGISHTIGG